MLKKICLLIIVCGFITPIFAQNYIAQPYYQDGKIRFYAQANPINPATVAYTLDLTAGMQAAWGVTPNASNGPNATVIYNNKLFVSFDLGLQKGGVLVYNMLDIAAPPTALKPGNGNGYPCAGMCINPANGDLYIATFTVNGQGGGIYYSTAASGYTNANNLSDYTHPSVDTYCANIYIDASNNLWFTTWSGNTNAAEMFLVCYKDLNKSNYYKIVNQATKSYTATSTAGVSASVYLLSAPEGLVRDASGNLWLGNNNDFSAVNTTTVAGITTYNGTLVKINNAFITNLLTQPVGTSATVPVGNVNAYHIINGKIGGIAISGNTLYINDQGQNQGSSYLTNGTVWRYDVTTNFNATSFKASGIRTTYPGNGQMAFSATLPIVAPPPPAATKLFVKASATGLNNGTSWTNAYTNLQSAIDNNTSGLDTIFVALGTYKPTRWPANCSNCSGNRTYTFEMRNNVKIFGGFVGNEKWLTQRPAIGTQPTILSGDIGTAGTSNDNTFHVVLLYNVSGVQIDGVTIRDGWADNWAEITMNGNPYTICNTSGAGVFANQSSFIIRNSTIGNNTIVASSGTSQYHTPYSGAGIYSNNHGTIDLINNNIANNWATQNGGGLFVDGYAANYVNISKCIFTNNTANKGGGVCLINTYPAYINESVFNTNTASYGGGLAADGGSVADISINNSVFTGNTINSSFAGLGAALFMVNLDGYSLLNSTIYNNHAYNGSALGAGLYEGNISVSPATRSGDIKNCIFYGNTTGNTAVSNIRDDIYSTNTNANAIAQVSNCLFGSSNTLINVSNIANNRQNINPLFLNAASPIGADNKWFTADDGLYPTCVTSPALNLALTAAASATDITGGIRFGLPDIGAYEAPCNEPAIFTSNSAACQNITTNTVTGNNWFHFTNAAGIVCSINPQGQNLGNVTAKVADPTGTVTSGTTRYMGRSVNLTSTIAPTTDYLLRLYFKDTEIAEFQAATGLTGLTPQSFKVLWASGGTGCGVNNFYGTTGGIFDNASITTGEFGQSNEGFYLQIALNHFTLFAASTDTQNTLVGTENEIQSNPYTANIYPNPTTEDLNIELTGNTDVEMEAQIFDMMGRKMTAQMPIQNGKANINMQDMPKGIYSLVITNGTQIVVSKRVVKL